MSRPDEVMLRFNGGQTYAYISAQGLRISAPRGSDAELTHRQALLVARAIELYVVDTAPPGGDDDGL